ncbi:uncharacterized protein C8Q71DRAFT_855349 [Rhodofomes roseus]|uniref:GATA-type domain-containing protein n=1 Tax=Rhodofomes roseus TaxID=34475 RepID=A0ABQ8KPH9_9APHY|nr:uncharacterized protein C8Q71DRAFT_855349 [Rhodofomes roseus]KAH9840055.1 hypothetical protein C8Q71DRAFT_855349 [Rhodofomes roseus]
MPAVVYSYDRPSYPGPVLAAVAHPPPRSSTPVSSYTSLDHALDPPDARESLRPVHQPPPSHPDQPPSAQMTSDSRYAYPPPPDAAPPYGYAPYPPPYAHGQYAQDMSRASARPASSSGQPAHPPPPHAPPPYHGPPGYPAHPPYGPPSYGVAPAPPGPWTGEGWYHYTHYSPPHPPGQEHPYSSNGSRPDPPAEEHRPYPPPPPRGEERPPRPAEAPPQSKVRNGRESEPPAPGPSRSSPPLGMDFGKLIEQYGILLETTASLTHPGNSPRLSIPQETMERMMQAAAFGMQTLESASRRAAPGEPPRPPPTSENTQEEAQDDGGDAKARQPASSGENGEGQTCLGCNATSTPEWRRGPMGPRTLCNACGLVYAKLIKKRNRDPNRGRGAYLNPPPGAQNATTFVDEHAHSSGGSDDEDSYGSQGRRSDGGYHGGRD